MPCSTGLNCSRITQKMVRLMRFLLRAVCGYQKNIHITQRLDKPTFSTTAAARASPARVEAEQRQTRSDPQRFGRAVAENNIGGECVCIVMDTPSLPCRLCSSDCQTPDPSLRSSDATRIWKWPEPQRLPSLWRIPENPENRRADGKPAGPRGVTEIFMMVCPLFDYQPRTWYAQ